MFNWHSQDRGSAHKEAPSYLRDHGLCFHLFSLPQVNETFFFSLLENTRVSTNAWAGWASPPTCRELLGHAGDQEGKEVFFCVTASWVSMFVLPFPLQINRHRALLNAPGIRCSAVAYKVAFEHYSGHVGTCAERPTVLSLKLPHAAFVVFENTTSTTWDVVRHPRCCHPSTCRFPEITFSCLFSFSWLCCFPHKPHRVTLFPRKWITANLCLTFRMMFLGLFVSGLGARNVFFSRLTRVNRVAAKEPGQSSTITVFLWECGFIFCAADATWAALWESSLETRFYVHPEQQHKHTYIWDWPVLYEHHRFFLFSHGQSPDSRIPRGPSEPVQHLSAHRLGFTVYTFI